MFKRFVICKKFTKCRHPKKDHDKCGETWYCMNCNEDLGYA